MAERLLGRRPVAQLARPPARHRVVLRRLLRNPAGLAGSVMTFVVVVVSTGAGVISSGDPFASAGPSLRPPSWGHLMGTDNFGRDLVGAVVHGTRTSMTLVAWVMAISLVIGLSVGTIAGYKGGFVDDVLMRLTEMVQSVPRFFLALLVVGLFGAKLQNLILLLGVTSWALLARVVRAEKLSARRREFVDAARAMGASDGRVLVRHILPHVMASALVVISLEGSRVVLIEAALSFLGLGDPNRMSLGYLLNNAQSFLSVAWWMSLFPGVAIVVAVLGLNLLGDAVNELTDPRARSMRPRWRVSLAARA
jgi:peptide/nickel transport system permease protein